MSMTAIRVIRPASLEDFEALQSLRRGHCQHVYKGFDVLCNLQDDQEFHDIFVQWLADSSIRISLLFLDQVLTAFCTYRFTGTSSGEILELQYQPDAALADIQLMVESVLKDMELAGVPFAQVWILRDNLRSRFHYQQFGFKPIGGSKEKKVGDTSLFYTRYVYCIKECPPEAI